MLVGQADWAVFGQAFAVVLLFAVAAFVWANMTFMRSRA
jgi:hypothetical protein